MASEIDHISIGCCVSRNLLTFLRVGLGKMYEKKELQGAAREYDRLCRAYGTERVAETVAAVKQQEQAEKEQKRSQKRRHDRDER